MYIPKCICPSVLLSAMPSSERLLPYKAFRVPYYLRRENIKRKVAESQSLFLTTENTKDTKIFRLFCVFRVQEKYNHRFFGS